jgi:hypothetical protein
MTTAAKQADMVIITVPTAPPAGLSVVLVPDDSFFHDNFHPSLTGQ